MEKKHHELKNRLIELGIEVEESSSFECDVCGETKLVFGLDCILSKKSDLDGSVYICLDCFQKMVPLAMDIFQDEFREKLAAAAHSSWSHWMEYLLPTINDGLSACVKLGKVSPVTEQLLERWSRQMKTRYADLSEEEQESDRAQADEIMKALGAGQRGRVERRFVGTGQFSSGRIETVGPHDKVRIWNRGGLAGELVLTKGDGEPMLRALGMLEKAEEDD